MSYNLTYSYHGSNGNALDGNSKWLPKSDRIGDEKVPAVAVAVKSTVLLPFSFYS